MKKVRNWLISGLLSLVCAFAMLFGIGLTNRAAVSYADAPGTEQAMEEFLDLVEARNYVIYHHYENSLHEEFYTSTSVCSQDLVYVIESSKINIGDPDHLYDGLAYMTINGNETFKGYLYGTGADSAVEDISFVSRDKAIKAYAGETLDPWLEIENWIDWFYCGEGIFPGEPYKYVSYVEEFVENPIVETWKALADFNGGAFGGGDVAEVYLEFTYEGENFVKAELYGCDEEHAELDNSRVVVTFGNAEADERAGAWMENPNTAGLPVMKNWRGYETGLAAIFLNGYEEMAFPFPKEFATYTFSVDVSRVLSNDEFIVGDSQATEANMQKYIQRLLSIGFKKVVDGDRTYYRRLIRPEHNCYSQLEITYNGGVNVIATTWYDFPIYNTLTQANQILEENGYPVLDDLTDGLEFVSATDRRYEMIESWLYFFDYEIVLYVEIAFDNAADIETYLQNYVDEKLGEFTEIDSTDDEHEEEYQEVEGYLNEEVAKSDKFKQIASDGKYWSLKNRDGVRTFKFHDNRNEDPLNNSVSLLFKYQKYITNEEVTQGLAENNFPKIDEAIVEKIDYAKDFVKYNKCLNDKLYDFDIAISCQFATSQQAVEFLDEYINNLIDNEGYLAVIPEAVGMKRGVAFYKSIEGTIWAFGVDYQDGWTSSMMEFRVDKTPKRIWWQNTDTVDEVDITEVFGEANTYGRGVELNIQDAVVTFDYEAAGVIAENPEVLFSFAVSDDVSGLKVKDAAKVLNIEITGFTAGKATIELPVDGEIPNNKVVKVYHVNAQGKKTDMKAKVVDGKIVFETTHFSQYVIAYENSTYNRSLGRTIGLVIAALLILGFAIYSGYYMFSNKKA